MSRPANQRASARIARSLLAKRLPGSRRGSVRQHLARSGHIAETIWRRWQVGPYQWRLKHLRWYLQERTGWIERLNGPWVRPTGVRGAFKAGRPVLEPSPPDKPGKAP